MDSSRFFRGIIAVMNVGRNHEPGGGRHGCYDGGGGSGKGRFRSGAGESGGADHRAQAADATAVRAIRRRRCRRDRGHHGGLRHGALLGPAMSGARIFACGCCRRSTCGRMCVATRRTGPIPRRCSKRRAVADIRPVPVKTVEQQTLQALHRVRTQWQAARTARINAMRGLLREHGLPDRRRRTNGADADSRDPRGCRRRAAGSASGTPSGSCSRKSERSRRGSPRSISSSRRSLATHPIAAPAPADSRRRRADRDGAGRGRESHPRVPARTTLCELARA